LFRVEFVQIAIDYKPLNLGQGLPDDLVPAFVIEELNEVVKEHTNPLHQYTRGFVSCDSLLSPLPF
jgi:kynurenine--oxoglutarate transaminase/cysteine-S-conjugate beta-lyase/glutamine--phenylpyruvate transaminase